MPTKSFGSNTVLMTKIMSDEISRISTYGPPAPPDYCLDCYKIVGIRAGMVLSPNAGAYHCANGHTVNPVVGDVLSVPVTANGGMERSSFSDLAAIVNNSTA